MLRKKKAEVNLHDERLFTLKDPPNCGSFSSRTSTLVLERKSLSYAKDSLKYRKFREALSRPCKRYLIMNNGKEMKELMDTDRSVLTGHLMFTPEEMDVFNQPIIEPDVRRTLSNRINDLLNRSYKSFIRKSSRIFKWKRKTSTNEPVRCEVSQCEHKNYVDLRNVDSACSEVSQANIVIV